MSEESEPTARGKFPEQDANSPVKANKNVRHSQVQGNDPQGLQSSTKVGAPQATLDAANTAAAHRNSSSKTRANLSADASMSVQTQRQESGSAPMVGNKVSSTGDSPRHSFTPETNQQTSTSSRRPEHDIQSELDELPQVDELVQEYLLYRGFTRTFHIFQEDRKADHLMGLSVTRIVDQLFSYVHQYDMPGLLSLWSFLNARFFYHLESHFRPVVLEFELALKRYYIVNTIQTNRKEEAVNFFTQYCTELNSGASQHGKHPRNKHGKYFDEAQARNNNNAINEDWKGWFALPFLPNPESSPQFKKYFDKSWSETLAISLRNFLSLILQNTPLPELLAFNIGRVKQHEQDCTIESQKAEIRLLKQQLADQAQLLKAKIDKDISVDDEGTIASDRNDNTSGETAGKSTSKLSKIFSAIDNSADEKRIRLNQTDQLLSRVDMNTKKYDAVHTETLKGHTSSVLCCKFSKDGSLIASGGADCTVRIWDLKAWQDSLHMMGATMAQLDDNISAIPNAYTEDGALREGHSSGKQHVFSSSNPRGHDVDDVESYDFWALYSQNGNEETDSMPSTGIDAEGLSPSHIPCHSTIYLSSEALCLDWTTSGPRKKPLLMFGTANHDVKVWDVIGQSASVEIKTGAAFPVVHCVRYVPSSSNHVVVASTNRQRECGNLEKWDLHTKKVVCSLNLGGNEIVVNSMDIDEGGSKLIVGCNDGDIRVYDLRGSPILIQRWSAHERGHHGFGGVTAVTFTRDGQVISSGGSTNEMVMWDVRNNDGVGIIRQYLTKDYFDGSNHRHSRQHNHCPVSLAWADNETLIRSSTNGSAVLHSLARQHPVQYLRGHTSPVLSVSWAIAPGCPLNSCATASLDNTLKIWALRKV